MIIGNLRGVKTKIDTWIAGSYGAGASKITIIVMPAGSLVIDVHGVGGMGSNRIRVKASPTFAYGLTIKP